MLKTVLILYMSGRVFQKIEYIDINNLIEILISLINCYNEDIAIQLILNNNILNTYNSIITLELNKLNNEDITIVFTKKKSYIF